MSFDPLTPHEDEPIAPELQTAEQPVAVETEGSTPAEQEPVVPEPEPVVSEPAAPEPQPAPESPHVDPPAEPIAPVEGPGVADETVAGFVSAAPVEPEEVPQQENPTTWAEPAEPGGVAESVDYPHPDDLQGATPVEVDPKKVVCPICAYEFDPGQAA